MRDPFCYRGNFWFGDFPRPEGFSLRAPISVSWMVTRRCQSACIFCCTDSHSRAPLGADIATIKRALDRLSEWGALRLIAGGGEPLVRHDIADILDHASGRGLAPTLATNGFLLDAGMAKRLAPSVMQFQISLDSVRPDEYAALRGAAGGPHLALRAIENAADAGGNVRVVTVLNSRNIDHLEEVAAAVERSAATQWFLFAVLPSGRGARLQHKLGLRDLAAARGRVADVRKNLRDDLAVCFWGDSADDSVAVYLTEDCQIELKDYSTNSRRNLNLDLGSALVTDYHNAWRQIDAGAKHATLKNFVSPVRAV
ncbi:radical SAM protein [Bradyrhizobium sp. HKCCYLS3013]|uniref:radical SAM protein n=1 Tax=Bradyrhizobium sp. HKCCYLS3013 TaxID=3420735 RepID=UPI003EBA6CA4